MGNITYFKYVSMSCKLSVGLGRWTRSCSISWSWRLRSRSSSSCCTRWWNSVRRSTWTGLGQSETVGWGLFCELCWVFHWYKPIHLESTGTDPEIPAGPLKKPFALILVLGFWKMNVVQEWLKGCLKKRLLGDGSLLCQSWSSWSSENKQRPILMYLEFEDHMCIWL